MQQPPDKYDKASAPSEELFHLIIESIKDYAIFMTDVDGRVVSWNPGVEKLLGYSESEIVGQPIEIIFTPEDRAAGVPAKEIQRAAQTGCSEDKRWHQRKDSSRFWANGMVMPVKADDGALHGFAKVMRDDTAQKLAEENLEQILSSITDSFFRFDREFRYTYVNRATTEMFGISEAEFLGKTLWEIFPDVEGNIFHREIQRALETKQKVVFENYYQPLDRWFENRIYPFADGLSVFTTEITKRKQDEEEIKQLSARAGNILESINDAFYALDRDWSFTYLNKQSEPLLERKREDLLGKNIWEEFPEAVGLTFYEQYHKAIAEQTTATFEEFYPPLGNWFEIRAYPSADGLSVYFHNISERKQAEMTLREAEERYRALIEATSTTVWHATPEGALNFVGDVWTEVSGQTVEEILKWGWLEAIHPDDRERTVEVWQTALRDKTLYSTEFRVLTVKGEYRWFAVNAVPVFDADNNVREWIGLNTDITERKQSEALLRESEQKFSTLADVVPQLVWMAEADGFIFWYNRNWYDYTGTTPEDMEGWGWQSVHDPEMLPQVMTRWKTSIETGEPFEMEFPLKGADGKLRWFLTRVNPLRDSKGEIIRWFGTNTDINEQRRLDQRNRFIITLDEAVRPLETPEEITLTLARLLGEHLGADRCAYAEVEADEDHFTIPGDYTRGNTHSIVGYYSMADFGAEVLRLMQANQPYVVDDVNTDERVTETDLAAYRMTAIESVICVPLHKNGRFTACMAVHQSAPRRWTMEEVELVTFVANRFWESIERARTDKNLRESEERFRALQQATPDGFMIFESVRDESGEIRDFRWVYANPAAEKIIGRPQAELLGKLLCEEMPGNRTDGLFEEYARVVETGKVWQNEFGYKHENLDHYFLSTAVRVGDGFAVGFSDVTERKRVENEREKLLASEQDARQQAEQANSLKDQFLATLSHELRTPLNAILGWSQMIQNRNLGETEIKKALSTIERSARAQNQLIDDLLDVSRIITGKLRLDVRAVDLPVVITAAVDAVRPAAEAKNIRLQTLLDPQALPISGDPDRLQQVVWNLLANAVKFTPKDGRVQIRLERINSHVEIVVSDTGKGIEPEFLPYVFDRFRQSDGSMTRRHGGLGLGLAIVRQLVELHGGTVSVTSEGGGQGATFTVSLPLLPVRREPPGDEPRVHPKAETGAGLDCPPELTGLRILLVEDEADSRDLLNVVLDSCGAAVTTAHSASDALTKIKQEKFDVIVSDIGMPEEDGFSLIGKIRSLPEEQNGNVPAIALTAYARAEDRVQALRSGFQMHIAKPVEAAELIASVANLAGRIEQQNGGENV